MSHTAIKIPGFSITAKSEGITAGDVKSEPAAPFRISNVVMIQPEQQMRIFTLEKWKADWKRPYCNTNTEHSFARSTDRLPVATINKIFNSDIGLPGHRLVRSRSGVSACGDAEGTMITCVDPRRR